VREGQVGSAGRANRNARQFRRPLAGRHRRRRRILVGNGASFGILDEKIDLVVLRAPIDWSDDDTGELAGTVNGGGLPIVLQHTDEMIAGPES
jgi:hypothetical protein